jgi:putative hydrolase of the HAD superfamily
MEPASKAVIFDFYFTLARPSLTDFTQLAATLGCSATSDEIDAHRRELLAAHPLSTPAFDGEPEAFRSFRAYWNEFGDELFRRLGVDGGGAAYADNRRHAHRSAQMYGDVAPALARLRGDGWAVAVLSDADRDDLTAGVRRTGFTFDAVLCSEDLGCYKPHRSCFHAACAALGIGPSDAVYVGDSPVNDVEGSRRAGLRSVWLNRRGLTWPEDLPPPPLVVDGLDELHLLLDS